MSNLIQRIEPTLVLTGNIDTIFDEIARPKVSYDITLRLNADAMIELLKFAEQAVEIAAKADNQTVLQLIAEFTQVVDGLAKK